MAHATQMRFGEHAQDYHYISQTFCREDALQTEARQLGESLYPGMQISALEGKTLAVLASLVNARFIMEIGTFVGYSTLWLARGLSAQGRIITLESNPEHARAARDFFKRSPYDARIDLREGKALSLLKDLPETPPFDLVFIDAAKVEYPLYLDCLLKRVRPGGLIVGDNTLLFGNLTGAPRQNASPEAVRAMQHFNQRLADEAQFQSILLPTVEGMTVAVKRA